MPSDAAHTEMSHHKNMSESNRKTLKNPQERASRKMKLAKTTRQRWLATMRKISKKALRMASPRST